MPLYLPDDLKVSPLRSCPTSPLALTDSPSFSNLAPAALLKGLGWLDRFLAPLVLLAMILGVIIGKFADNVEGVLKGATLEGVSVREFGSLGFEGG